MASKMAQRLPSSTSGIYTIALVQQHEDQRHERLATLQRLDCLHQVSTEELSRLLDLCVLRAFVPGSTLVSEHEASRFLYFLLQGDVQLTLHDRDGHEVLVGILSRGDCCGESQLFGNFFRRARVRADTVCYALQVPLSDLQVLLPSLPTLSAALREIHRRRMVESTLVRVPLFSQLLPLERLALAALLQRSHYSRGSVIVRHGEPGEALCLIESGQIVVEQHGVTIASLQEGDFFGEIALLSDRPHNATVRAFTATDILALPAADFHWLLAQRPELEAQLHTVVEQRLSHNATMRTDQDRVRHLNLAVEHGLLRGSRLLVRTPELCPPGCRICEDACASRHGQTRLHLNGVQIGDFDVVDTCRQCRIDAECVEACLEDAIQWNDQGALVITDKCTGCGDCVQACPYDAVTRKPLNPNPPNGPLWKLWSAMQQRLNKQRHIIPLETTHYTHRADKCDLCHNYDNLACLSACPTGSLRLMPVEELFPL